MDQRSNDITRQRASSLRDVPDNFSSQREDAAHWGGAAAATETWDVDDGDERSADEIRAEIRRTRDRLDHTIDELQNRLSLKQMVRGATEAVRENMGDPVQRVMCVIQKNPLPIALIGIGAVWLLIQEAKARKAEDEFTTELEYSEYEGYSERLKPVL